jgi:hypothetical protein
MEKIQSAASEIFCLQPISWHWHFALTQWRASRLMWRSRRVNGGLAYCDLLMQGQSISNSAHCQVTQLLLNLLIQRRDWKVEQNCRPLRRRDCWLHLPFAACYCIGFFPFLSWVLGNNAFSSRFTYTLTYGNTWWWWHTRKYWIQSFLSISVWKCATAMSTIKPMLKLWSKFIVWYVRWLECPGVRKISSRECEQRQPNTSDFHRGKAVTDGHSAV